MRKCGRYGEFQEMEDSLVPEVERHGLRTVLLATTGTGEQQKNIMPREDFETQGVCEVILDLQMSDSQLWASNWTSTSGLWRGQSGFISSHSGARARDFGCK